MARDLYLACWHHTTGCEYKRNSHLNKGKGIFVYEVEITIQSYKDEEGFLQKRKKIKNKQQHKCAS